QRRQTVVPGRRSCVQEAGVDGDIGCSVAAGRAGEGNMAPATMRAPALERQSASRALSVGS
ncbi:MAG TPA: hypothetical protein VIP79_05930, partial [Gemmatimonadaceae bacterium]